MGGVRLALRRVVCQRDENHGTGSLPQYSASQVDVESSCKEFSCIMFRAWNFATLLWMGVSSGSWLEWQSQSIVVELPPWWRTQGEDGWLGLGPGLLGLPCR